MYDVIVIGAGVIGCSIARELSRYQIKIAVLEKCSDICEGTSKANSGIVHAGYDAKAGSIKSKLNVEGNRMMESLSKDLDIPFHRNGSLVLSFREEEREILEDLLQNGLKNKVPDIRIIKKEEVQHLEPNISEDVVAALYAPTGGIICPFTLNIALAENACTNGVEFFLETEVVNIEKQQRNRSSNYQIQTSNGRFDSRIVINAAGVYADNIHNMVSENKIKIIARKGEYCLFDKNLGSYIKHTLFQTPGKFGKGILVTPTVHGNLMIGPTATDVENKELTTTTQSAMEEIIAKAERSVKHIPKRQIITSFSGLRAHTEGNDFIIGEVVDAPGFIDVAGIESPGLSCTPAIGKFVAELVTDIDIIPLVKKIDFISTRKGIPHIIELPKEERDKLIKETPAYGNVVCRCETITEGEIIDAIQRPIGAKTLDGIKRRTRSGSGRCQAGFCTPKIMEILARELQINLEDISKSSGESNLIIGKNKEIGWMNK
ncbi:MAG: putative dehydrogenase [Clostridiales bacterium]|jgi:glycerol-3-phosphate dehydrogenase|nr:putative dehydrogenase [Clostridiales bacterium]